MDSSPNSLFTCGICVKVSTNQKSFSNHIKVHQQVDCNFCGKQIPLNSKKYHESKCSGNLYKKFSCDKCDFKTEFSSHLQRHKKSHEEGRKRLELACDVCEKSFQYKKHLTEHKQSHGRIEEIYKCYVCDKSFIKKKNYENHMKSQHIKTKLQSTFGFGVFENSTTDPQKNNAVPKFQCNECDYSTDHLSHFKKHEKTKHKIPNLVHVCNKCDYSSKRKLNVDRHMETCKGVKSKSQKYRDLNKLKKNLDIKDKNVKQKQFSEEDVRRLIDDHKGSLKDLKNTIKWIRHSLGRKVFTPNINKIINEHINILSHCHTSEPIIMKGKKGEDIQTVLSKVTDMNDFIAEIVAIRQIEKPKVVLGSDGGQDKCIVTCTIMEEDYEMEEEEDTSKDYKPTGRKRVLVVAKIDEVPETRNNVEVLLNALNLPDIRNDFQLVCDLKLCSMILGLQTCTAMYSCPWCEAYKIDTETNEMTNKRGIFVPGPLRTVNNISENQAKWATDTDSNRKKLLMYKNCEFKPIELRKNQGDKEVLFLLPPDPLHVNLLGPGNDCMDLLEKKWPCEIKDEFYVKHNLKKSGEGKGGKFNGNSIRYILRENVLNDLEATLPNYQVAQQFTTYLRSLRDLHKMSIEKTVPSNYKEIIGVFKAEFYNLYMEHELNMTLKIHVILEHYAYYFEKSGKTFRHTNGEFTETCHSSLKQSEQSHGLKVKRTLGTPVHQNKSWQSLVIYNSKRAGYTTPLRLRSSPSCPSPNYDLRTPNSSPNVSSPTNDPFSHRFKKRFPEAVSLHYQYLKKLSSPTSHS